MVELVLNEDDSGVRLLTLNRPAQLNAFDQDLCEALITALGAATADSSVRVVVLTGAGRAFSAGTDLLELKESGEFRGSATDPHRFERLIDVLAGFPKPLICAVNGVAVGLGVTLLGHADLVVMASSARLKCPFTQLSLAPEAASSVMFPLQLGRQAAAWLLLSSEWMDAREAKEVGLAWRVVPDEDTVGGALALAGTLAAHSLESLTASKRLLAATYASAITAGRARENAAFDILLKTRESRAAIAAFVAGRRKNGSEPAFADLPPSRAALDAPNRLG